MAAPAENALPMVKTAAGLALVVLAGCTVAPSDDVKLNAAIKTHYADHATEEEGACLSPKIDTIQAKTPVGRTTDGSEVMLVRYSYFDSQADMDADWDKLVYLSQPCGGIAERRFVLTRDDLGYRVNVMDGESRKPKSDR